MSHKQIKIEMLRYIASNKFHDKGMNKTATSICAGTASLCAVTTALCTAHLLLSELNKISQEVRNRRRRAKTRKQAKDSDNITLGSRTTTTDSGEGHCGRSGSESDIREYETWAHRDKSDKDVSENAA